MSKSRLRRKLQDTYRFPGFVPAMIIHGIYGNPQARVVSLTRRQKKQPVESVVGGTAATTTASSRSCAIYRVATYASTWRWKSVNSFRLPSSTGEHLAAKSPTISLTSAEDSGGCLEGMCFWVSVLFEGFTLSINFNTDHRSTPSARASRHPRQARKAFLSRLAVNTAAQRLMTDRFAGRPTATFRKEPTIRFPANCGTNRALRSEERFRQEFFGLDRRASGGYQADGYGEVLPQMKRRDS